MAVAPQSDGAYQVYCHPNPVALELAWAQVNRNREYTMKQVLVVALSLLMVVVAPTMEEAYE